MSFFSHKQKDALILILDIQSSVVHGTLILQHQSELPHVVWTLNIDIPYYADKGSAYLVRSAISAVESISLSAHTYVRDTHAHPDLPTHISAVHCVLSSPWIMSQARTVTEKFEKDTLISRTHIQKIIQDERARLTEAGGETMVEIEEKIFDVRLNGYSISKWEHCRAKRLEVSFAVSLAGKHTIRNFTNAAKRSGAHGGHIHFHSSLLLQHLGIGNVLSMTDPYILIHIHGELTDIVVSTADTCILFGSHPMGLRMIVRALSEKLNISLSTADSLLSLYENNQLDPLHSAPALQCIQETLSTWTAECLKVIALAPDGYHAVQVLISSRFHENIFKNSFSVTNQSLKTGILPEDVLYKLAIFDNQAERSRLTMLYMNAIHSLKIL